MLVIDELGYLSHAPDAANVLYRVINERYLQNKPMLLTTNKPLAALGDVLHDGDLAEAILDRLLERGVHYAMRGRSYRTRHLTEEENPTRRATTASPPPDATEFREKQRQNLENAHPPSGAH